MPETIKARLNRSVPHVGYAGQVVLLVASDQTRQQINLGLVTPTHDDVTITPYPGPAFIPTGTVAPDPAVFALWVDTSTEPPILRMWSGVSWVPFPVGGTGQFQVVSNNDGTLSLLGNAVVDNGDGTLTLSGPGVTNNPDGTLSVTTS